MIILAALNKTGSPCFLLAPETGASAEKSLMSAVMD
jgi:hypothetical protein